MAGRTASKIGDWLRRAAMVLIVLLVLLPVLLLALFRFVPVPFTPQMLIGLVTGDTVRYQWREAWELSPYLAKAVIGGEDEKFCRHHGFGGGGGGGFFFFHERHPRKQLRG